MSDKFYTAVQFVQALTVPDSALTTDEAIRVVKLAFPELFGAFADDALRAEVERRAGR